MALPLPRVVADTEAGGPFVTALRGMNALEKSNLENQISRAEARYKPTTLAAEAASKLAYSQLMGPQFLAKLMGNDAFVGNLGDERAKATAPMLYNAALGQGAAGNIFNQLQSQNQQSNNPLSQIVDMVKGAFGFGQNPLSQPSQQPIQNSMVNMPSVGSGIQATPYQAAAVNNMQPGEAVTLDANGNPSVAYTPNESTYGEKAGKYKGIVKEGEESGTIRAKNIDELNDLVLESDNNKTTLNEMSKIVQSPEFEQIRQVPLAGHHEIDYYEKEGTPQQKALIGRLKPLLGQFIIDASTKFKGVFRGGEQSLLQDMKPNINDTVETMRGKVEMLSYLNDMLGKRSELVSTIMEDQHISKGKALKQADQQLNGDKIREEIQDKIYPKIFIRNKKTDEKRSVTISEARKLGLKVGI